MPQTLSHLLCQPFLLQLAWSKDWSPGGPFCTQQKNKWARLCYVMQQEIMLARTWMEINIAWISVERTALEPPWYEVSVAVSAFVCHGSKQDFQPDWIPWAQLPHKWHKSGISFLPSCPPLNTLKFFMLFGFKSFKRNSSIIQQKTPAGKEITTSVPRLHQAHLGYTLVPQRREQWTGDDTGWQMMERKELTSLKKSLQNTSSVKEDTGQPSGK